MKNKSKMVKPKNEWYFVDRVYRWLPIFLLLFGVGNVYFVINYVNSEKRDFEIIRDKAILNASNAYVFVESTLTNEIYQTRSALSNEIRRVSMANAIRLRPFSVPTTNTVIEVDIAENKTRIDRKYVNARYFRIGGRPFLDVNGSYYTVGDDFGFGVVDNVYPTGVVCDGVFLAYETKKEIALNGN